MTWQRTSRHYLAVPADELWEIVGDPRRWPIWSGAIRSFTLEPALPHEYADPQVSRTAQEVQVQGLPAVVGQQGHYLPSRGWAAALHGRTAGPLHITEVVPGRSLGFEQPAPGGSATRVRWELTPHEDGGTTLE
ncbi:SRPBCC family protein [Ornithinimicrobium sp. F0845]|uniref:SRPBCC family protein n=1 Tax=Ornithinimicrobium sp. F0845 TaxID=2926412 RepID=UPI001FF685BF|nr:SRPBCC family protein [Ornithinimicrobium sp. F0845]MCK0113946.1 SRPBCC family protein [Ornithinimicrobium sp. F0845]